jgi:hypothetical protein
MIVLESPAVPVWTSCWARLPLRTTVTVEPWSAWVGIDTPVSCAVMMSAEALMPAFSLLPVWSSVSDTG